MIRFVHHLPIAEILMSIFCRLGKEKFESCAILFYYIWREPNNFIHGNSLHEPTNVLEAVGSSLCENQQAKLAIDELPIKDTPPFPVWRPHYYKNGLLQHFFFNYAKLYYNTRKSVAYHTIVKGGSHIATLLEVLQKAMCH